jgi:hypothetical protein
MSSYDNLADNFRGFKGILGDFRGFYECDFAQDFDEGRPGGDPRGASGVTW